MIPHAVLGRQHRLGTSQEIAAALVDRISRVIHFNMCLQSMRRQHDILMPHGTAR